MGVIARQALVVLTLAISTACATAVRAQMLEGIPSIWNGAYAGVHGGVNAIDISSEAYGYQTSSQQSAPFGGVHVGALLGRGNLAAGLEGDFNFETAGESTTLSVASNGAPLSVGAKAQLEASASFRGRLGYTFDNMMIFGTFGYAWANTSLEIAATPGGSAQLSQGFNGLVFGGGAEAIVVPRMRVRIEALRYEYGAIKGGLPALPALGLPGSTYEFDPSSTVVRAGVSFQLN